MKKAVGYCRVSTSEQAIEGVSLDNQRRKIELYCEMNDMQLVGVEVDEGISAKNLNRPAVKRVLDMARRREVDCIVIYKLDRMFRNTVDALNTSQMLDRQGIGFISISESIDTKSAIGKFFFSLMASLAEMERNVISERTATAMQYKRSNGEHCGNAPFGYEIGPDGVHLIENEIEQEIVRRIVELRAAGFSLRKISDALNAEGCCTRSGGAWRHEYINNILRSAA